MNETTLIAPKDNAAALEPFNVRAERVLACTFRGLHNAPKIHKMDDEYWEVNHYGELATFDFDGLTRLVVAAHMNCIRAAVMSSGPRMVKIRLHGRRGRDGMMHERHPTIREAVETIEGYGQYFKGA
jgi:hypothetical protein